MGKGLRDRPGLLLDDLKSGQDLVKEFSATDRLLYARGSEYRG
jgi:hypothetical protein